MTTQSKGPGLRVLVTGATGFIGRALVLRLLREGHAVTAWVRSVERARTLLGAEVSLAEAAGGSAALVAAVEQADAIVNLAGAPVAGRRWTARRRAEIADSRVAFTNGLVDAMAVARRRPAVLLSASAVGYYGDCGDQAIDESRGPGQGFLAEVCTAWEAAAVRAEGLGVRVLRMRLGVVLGLGGGFLDRLLPLFRAGLGARPGNGRQFLPWIHLDDLVAAITGALVDERYQGVVDLVAPQARRMSEVTRALSQAVGRGVHLAVPGALLRLGLGQAAEVVLGSQRLEGARLRALGFEARFPTLTAALADLLAGSSAVQIERLVPSAPAPVLDAPYLRRRRPAYLLRSRVILGAPVDEVFRFFSRPQNLGVITPPGMSFRIRQAPDEVGAGGTIDYTLRVAGAPIRWRTVIEHWAPQSCFVDAQERGPYRSWWHEHHFTAEGAGTVMEDRVYYAPPLGPLGRLAQWLFVASQLRDVFGYRSQAIRLRFPAG
jgi:uncharacterized protein (TIGR01777 family)